MLKLAYCGNDCNQCPRYIATQSGTEQLEQVDELWKRLGYRDELESPGKMSCYGCSSVPSCRYGIKECALEGKVDNCGRCSKYPCDKIDTMFQWTLKHVKKMKDCCSKEEYELMLNMINDKKHNPDYPIS